MAVQQESDDLGPIDCSEGERVYFFYDDEEAADHLQIGLVNTGSNA